MTTDLCRELELPAQGIETDSVVLRQWINDQAKTYQLVYLLAHAEDGVIWGHFNKGDLLTSGEVFDNLPVLRSLTLQQCRIFGKPGEILLWKTEQGWRSRLCQEKGDSNIDLLEEDQLLWGTKKARDEKDGFTLLADGSQGLKHAVPLVSIPFSEERTNVRHPVHLKVHHYIAYDPDDGLASIFLSRLVDLFSKV